MRGDIPNRERAPESMPRCKLRRVAAIRKKLGERIKQTLAYVRWETTHTVPETENGEISKDIYYLNGLPNGDVAMRLKYMPRRRQDLAMATMYVRSE